MYKTSTLPLVLIICTLLMNCSNQKTQMPQKQLALDQWRSLETIEAPEQRHEATFVEYQHRFFSLGGRQIKPISIFDPATNRWSKASNAPIEIHHFQAISYDHKIWIMGAMTGPYPNETSVPNIMIYDPQKDTWETGSEIPESRRRGGAGAVVYKDKFYLISGIERGHRGGFVKWFDEYDPKTGLWRVLTDAPHARDHFQAAMVNDTIYAIGGRNTSGDTNEVFNLLVPQVDLYNFQTARWSTLPETSNLPTPRAGTSALTVKGQLLIIGGESARKGVAHNEVEALDPTTNTWRTLSPLNQGRHGTGVIEYNNKLWTCCGSGAQGGSPELTTTEVVDVL
jgi:N-acetylneuraminic acid mutarotase